MNLIELDGTEQNPVYRRLERENNLYGFLDSYRRCFGQRAAPTV